MPKSAQLGSGRSRAGPDPESGTIGHPPLSPRSCVVAEDHMLWGLTHCALLGHLSSVFASGEWVEPYPAPSSAPSCGGPIECLASSGFSLPQLGGSKGLTLSEPQFPLPSISETHTYLVEKKYPAQCSRCSNHVSSSPSLNGLRCLSGCEWVRLSAGQKG